MGLFGGSVGAALGKVPGLSVLGSNEGPQLNTVALSPEAQKLVNEADLRSAKETPDSVSQGLMKNTGMADTLNGGENTTAQDPNMLQAIRNQYSGGFNKDLQKFKNQMDVQSKLEHGNRMANAAQHSLAAQQVQTQNNELLSQAYQQNEAARAGAISSIIGLAQTGMIAHSLANKNTNNASASSGGDTGNSSRSLNSFMSTMNASPE